MADSSGGGPNRPKPHIYVPMPQSDATYGKPSGDGMPLRDRLIRQYGEVSVMHAEVAACVTIMKELGLIHPQEFVELVTKALAAADLRRQRQAESGGRTF